MLLYGCLQVLGYVYGDFDVYNGLWEMCEKIVYDGLVWMVLVLCVFEVCGLDVILGMIVKLCFSGDVDIVDVLEIILCEEVVYVVVGLCWYCWYCICVGVELWLCFMVLLKEYVGGFLYGLFNFEVWLLVGFDEDELVELIEQIEMCGQVLVSIMC